MQEEDQKGGDMCIHIVDSLCCTTETNTTFKAMIHSSNVYISSNDTYHLLNDKFKILSVISTMQMVTLIKVKKHPYFPKKGFLYQKFKEILTCFLVDNLSAIQSILNNFFGPLFRYLYVGVKQKQSLCR